MSGEHGNEPDGPEPNDSGAEDRPRGFHLKAGLRSLSDLLGNLVEVTVSEPPAPPDDAIGWASVGESSGEQRRNDAPERNRTERVRRAEPDEFLIDTHVDDGEFVIVADVPGASKEELSVGIHPERNEFVIGKGDVVLERIDLPWKSVEPTRVWFNNGVLEVHLRPTDS